MIMYLEVCTFGQDGFKCSLGFGLKVLTAILMHHTSQQVTQHITLGQCTRMVGSMTTYLTCGMLEGKEEEEEEEERMRVRRLNDAVGRRRCGIEAVAVAVVVSADFVPITHLGSMR